MNVDRCVCKQITFAQVLCMFKSDRLNFEEIVEKLGLAKDVACAYRISTH